ncbi:fructokinase [Gilliamella sp. wkB108]|uniref:ROK family protein n=1 Tax=Gilliamella sp. wkB108 TaxID=3120256 RepID=UPI00080EAF5A|nr:ROK family protein [Gilliamella apicola]OCG20926.1 fructokinase [Gilliamella apicola]
MLGSIEAGGTKFVCAISDFNLNIIDHTTIDTDEPNSTLKKVFDFFSNHTIKSLGLGCFGPIDINIQSPNYGCITSTPKLAWRNFNILKALSDNISVPIALNTDVNVAAYAEYHKGAAINTNNCIYLTIGTGIGGGIIINKKIIDSRHHPELGHIFIQKREDDHYIGNCPYHKHCLEGLAAGPAIEKRWNMKPIAIPDTHNAWELEAYYLAQAIVNYTLTLSPDIIILGGGIMHKSFLLPMIKSQVLSILNGYFPIDNIEQYIVLPKLGDKAGIIGGLLLAKELLQA